MKTLPVLAGEWGVKTHAIRSFLRRRPAVQALAVRIGHTFGWTPEAAAKLKEVFDARPRRETTTVAG